MKTIKERIEEFDKGLYSSGDRETQCNAGWYDWFCKDSALKNKTKKLYRFLKQIADSPLIDKNKDTVYFKNGCPLYGNTFDVIVINSFNNTVYTIVPRSGFIKDNGYGFVYSGTEEVFKGSWIEIRRWFKRGDKYV